ncbi:MAG: hypothetical protein PHI85_04170 [Victivallaceae bacterium]|nr:hypothetical protein [Victivallaceae bacterium]
MTATGAVDADEAKLNFDLSGLKPEDGVILNDLALGSALSYAVTVDTDQDKGDYRLADAAGAFAVGAMTGGVSSASADFKMREK